MGFDIDWFCRYVREVIENLEIDDRQNSTVKRSLKYFMRDITQVLHLFNEIADTFYKKIVRTGIFDYIKQQMNTKEFRGIVNDLLALPEIRTVLREFQNMEVDIIAWISINKK